MVQASARTALLAGVASLVPLPALGAQDLLLVDDTGDRVLRYDGVTGAYIGVHINGIVGNGAAGPYGIDTSPDGSILYVSDFDLRVYRYDTVSGAGIGASPFINVSATASLLNTYGLAVHPTTGDIHLGSQSPSNATGHTQRFTSAGAAAPGTNVVKSGSTFSDNLAGRPRFVTFNASGELFASQTDLGSPTGNRIYRVDSTGAATVFADLDASSTASPEAWGLTFGPSFNSGGTDDLYVAVTGGGQARVRVFEGSTGAFIDNIDMPNTTWGPSGVGFNPNDPNQLIVLSQNGGGSRSFEINGDGTFSDLGAFLVGGPSESPPAVMQMFTFAAIPEPASVAILGLGAIFFRRRLRS